MNWPYRTITTIIVLLLALAVGWGVAQAGNPPRPDCAPPAKPHCKIHWVAYDYEQYGVDQFGNHYVRDCHVSAKRKRSCGAWLLLRRAFPVHHATKADLP